MLYLCQPRMSVLTKLWIPLILEPRFILGTRAAVIVGGLLLIRPVSVLHSRRSLHQKPRSHRASGVARGVTSPVRLHRHGDPSLDTGRTKRAPALRKRLRQ